MTSAADVTDLAWAHFPDRSLQSVEPIQQGFNNVIFEVEFEDRTVVVKTRDSSSQSRFASGVHVTSYLAASDRVPVPEVLLYDPSREQVPFAYVVLEHAGQNRYDEYHEMRLDRREGIVSELGTVLRGIHRTDRTDASRPHYGIVGGEFTWWQVFESLLDEHLDALTGTIFADMTTTVADARSPIRTCVPDDVVPRLLHGDFRMGNVLFRGDDVSAVIDWEESLAGHVEFDIVNAEVNLVNRFEDPVANELRERFYEGYGATFDEGFVRRRRVYALCPLLEAMSAFDIWGADLPAQERTSIENRLRSQVKTLVDRLNSDEQSRQERLLDRKYCE